MCAYWCEPYRVTASLKYLLVMELVEYGKLKKKKKKKEKVGGGNVRRKRVRKEEVGGGNVRMKKEEVGAKDV